MVDSQETFEPKQRTPGLAVPVLLIPRWQKVNFNLYFFSDHIAHAHFQFHEYV